MKKRKEFRHLTEQDDRQSSCRPCSTSPTISRSTLAPSTTVLRTSITKSSVLMRISATKDRPGRNPHRESSIGLIQCWFLPKGTDLSQVSNQTFQSMLHLLNHKYRKSNGYLSAYELAHERGIIEKVPKVSLTKAIAFR